MDRWAGKLAIVTGAGGGIGAAIAEALVKNGVNVLALDIKIVRLFSLKERVKSAAGKIFPKQCDVNKLEEVQSAFQWAKDNAGGVDILINNAGVLHFSKLTDGDTEGFRKVLETNVLAVAVFTKEAVQSMRARGVDGHIININSISGHRVHDLNTGLYAPSKFAITALTETVRKELAQLESKIKVTSISPGSVTSEIIDSAAAEANIPVSKKDIPRLEPSDIADSVIYILSTPPNVQSVTKLVDYLNMVRYLIENEKYIFLQVSPPKPSLDARVDKDAPIRDQLQKLIAEFTIDLGIHGSAPWGSLVRLDVYPTVSAY